MKLGVVTLITVENGFWGLDCSKGRGKILPGGKIGEGESLKEAAVREVKEEIGLELDVRELCYLYGGPDRNDYYVYTFLCLNLGLEFEPYLSREGAGCIITFDELVNNKVFGDYYQILMDILATE